MTLPYSVEVRAFFRSHGITQADRLSDLCAFSASQLQPNEKHLDGARRQVSEWMHQALGLESSASMQSVAGWERVTFLASGMAAQAPELLFHKHLSAEWRAKLAACVPVPTPVAVPGVMAEQSLSAIPALGALRSFLLPAGPEEGQEPLL